MFFDVNLCVSVNVQGFVLSLFLYLLFSLSCNVNIVIIINQWYSSLINDLSRTELINFQNPYLTINMTAVNHNSVYNETVHLQSSFYQNNQKTRRRPRRKEVIDRKEFILPCTPYKLMSVTGYSIDKPYLNAKQMARYNRSIVYDYSGCSKGRNYTVDDGIVHSSFTSSHSQ